MNILIFFLSDFENIKKEKCYGKKSAYLIEKVLDDILLAKESRESDGHTLHKNCDFLIGFEF